MIGSSNRASIIALASDSGRRHIRVVNPNATACGEPLQSDSVRRLSSDGLKNPTRYAVTRSS